MESKSFIFNLNYNDEANINLTLYIDTIIICGSTYKSYQKLPFCNIIICNNKNIYKIKSNKYGNYFITVPRDKYNILVYNENKSECKKIKQNINIKNFFL